jgi:hypothetical protein
VIGYVSLHFGRALAHYDFAARRPLATRFGQASAVSILSFGSIALGYPEAALNDSAHALKDACEISHAATLMYALCLALSQRCCANLMAFDATADLVASPGSN